MTSLAPAKLFWGRFLGWAAGGMAIGVSLAWLSYQLQAAGLAPIGLFSLALGAALGAILWGGLRLFEFGHRRAALAATLLIALTAAGAQHVFAYLAYRDGFRQSVENNPKAAIARTFNPDFGPAGFWGFIEASSRRRGAVALWVLDAVLIAAAALTMVALVTRRPYCNACRRWYRTTKQGSLDETAARELAAALSVSLPASARQAHYRIRSCLRECGPIQCRLSWTNAGGSETAQAWLEPAGFLRVQTYIRSPAAGMTNSEAPMTNE